MQRFKRSTLLPRVQRVLGFLRSVQPSSLLDIGTGRGAFLWPLLDAFPDLPVHCVDVLPHRVEMLEEVRKGGIENLTAEVLDATTANWPEDSRDVVTALEVLEHMTSPQQAIENCVRCASRYVVASVPSKEDDNPEHLQLFGPAEITQRFLDAGARKAVCEHVLNHRIVFVTV
ncbi:MAG: class I SAM-dependent methyltransferase [Planctomycetota bacterium]